MKWLRRRLRDHARTGREEAAIPEEDEVRVALDRLYREHAAAMRRTLMAEGPDEDEAEDVVHEVFKSLVERRKCDVGRRYLAKAARLCMWRRRQAAGNREVSLAGKGDGWWSEGEALPKEKTEIDLELLRLVEDGIHQRPEPKRTIMRLTCAAGWSPSTVAELMGTTPSQVKSCRRRVVEELRETKAHAGQEHCREDTMGSPVRTGRDPFSGG